MICQHCGVKLSPLNRTIFCTGCHLLEAMHSALPGPAIPTPPPEVAESLRKSGFRPTGSPLEPATPTKGTPGPDSRVLDAIERNILMVIDVTALKLAHTKDGSSAAKTLKGYLRAWKEALDLVRNERRGAAL